MKRKQHCTCIHHFWTEKLILYRTDNTKFIFKLFKYLILLLETSPCWDRSVEPTEANGLRGSIGLLFLAPHLLSSRWTASGPRLLWNALWTGSHLEISSALHLHETKLIILLHGGKLKWPYALQ